MSIQEKVEEARAVYARALANLNAEYDKNDFSECGERRFHAAYTSCKAAYIAVIALECAAYMTHGKYVELPSGVGK